jgi:hypothetical protein
MFRGVNLSRTRDANLSAPVSTAIQSITALYNRGKHHIHAVFDPRPVTGFKSHQLIPKLCPVPVSRS